VELFRLPLANENNFAIVLGDGVETAGALAGDCDRKKSEGKYEERVSSWWWFSGGSQQAKCQSQYDDPTPLLTFWRRLIIPAIKQIDHPLYFRNQKPQVV